MGIVQSLIACAAIWGLAAVLCLRFPSLRRAGTSEAAFRLCGIGFAIFSATSLLLAAYFTALATL